MKVIINGFTYHKPTDKRRAELKKKGFVYATSLDGKEWHGAVSYEIAKTYEHSWSL